MVEADVEYHIHYGNKKKRRPRRTKITEQQIKFCEAYLEHGQNAKRAAEIADYSVIKCPNIGSIILHKKVVKKYLQNRVYKLRRHQQLTVEKKLDKLNIVIDAAIPDNTKSIKDLHAIGIAAIAESNKMQGHYAPEKSITAKFNINTDKDLREAKDIALQLLTNNNIQK